MEGWWPLGQAWPDLNVPELNRRLEDRHNEGKKAMAKTKSGRSPKRPRVNLQSQPRPRPRPMRPLQASNRETGEGGACHASPTRKRDWRRAWAFAEAGERGAGRHRCLDRRALRKTRGSASPGSEPLRCASSRPAWDETQPRANRSRSRPARKWRSAPRRISARLSRRRIVWTCGGGRCLNRIGRESSGKLGNPARSREAAAASSSWQASPHRATMRAVGEARAAPELSAERRNTRAAVDRIYL